MTRHELINRLLEERRKYEEDFRGRLQELIRRCATDEKVDVENLGDIPVPLPPASSIAWEPRPGGGLQSLCGRYSVFPVGCNGSLWRARAGLDECDDELDTVEEAQQWCERNPGF